MERIAGTVERKIRTERRFYHVEYICPNIISIFSGYFVSDTSDSEVVIQNREDSYLSGDPKEVVSDLLKIKVQYDMYFFTLTLTEQTLKLENEVEKAWSEYLEGAKNA